MLNQDQYLISKGYSKNSISKYVNINRNDNRIVQQEVYTLQFADWVYNNTHENSYDRNMYLCQLQQRINIAQQSLSQRLKRGTITHIIRH